MAEVVRIIPAARDAVFAVLADPYTYPRWVVGAERIRHVEGNWPEPGARFHHVVGMFPFHLRDSTGVVEMTEGHLLVLDARARPAGRAQVEFVLDETPGGTRVRMTEFPTGAPATLIPEPIIDASIKHRNRRSLARLEAVVTGRR